MVPDRNAQASILRQPGVDARKKNPPDRNKFRPGGAPRLKTAIPLAIRLSAYRRACAEAFDGLEDSSTRVAGCQPESNHAPEGDRRT